MLINKSRVVLFIALVILLASCSSAKKMALSLRPANISSLHFLGEYDLPYNMSYQQTTVGGLSGIDYDPASHLYYLISDDRSAINPARFYTANIFFTQKGIDSVQLTGVKSMLQANGKVYPNNKQDAHHTPDPEAIRYNPIKKQLVWSSEGERIVNAKDTILLNPSVTIISTDGKFIDSFPIPDNLVMHATEKGPRQNGVLEGLSFTTDYKTLFVNVEEPLYEDGPRADIVDNNAYIRILKFNTATKKNTAQFAYKLDPVAYPPIPAASFKINGVPDVYAIDNNKLLVIERSFSNGRLPCTIKVFLTDVSGATDISTIPSLKTENNFIPAEKKLLLNMDSLGFYIDNIEGVTAGPLLPNGHKTLLFISDNNFAAFQKSQVLLFEVME